MDNAGDGLATLAMLGKEVFKHAVTRMKNSANLVIERAGLQPDDIAVVIPHQANLRIIDAIASRLAVPNDRVFVNLAQIRQHLGCRDRHCSGRSSPRGKNEARRQNSHGRVRSRTHLGGRRNRVVGISFSRLIPAMRYSKRRTGNSTLISDTRFKDN